MQKKFTLLPALAAAAALAFFPACESESDDNTGLLLLGAYFLDQNSGNCVVALKAADNSYIATGNGVPKGGCSQPTLAPIVSAKAEAKTVNDAAIDAAAALATAAGCDASVATAITDRKSALTADALETAANGAANKCTTLADQQTSFCTDGGSALLADVRYVVAGDVLSDMATTVAAQKESLKSGSSSSGWSNAAIDNLRLASAGELTTLRTLLAASAQVSGVSGTVGTSVATACNQRILQTQRDLSLAVYGGTIVTGTASDAGSVSQVIAQQMQCVYGSASTETATTKSCVAAYEQF